MYIKGIQLRAEIYYDDGTVGVMHTPLYKKDIRHGDLFPDHEAQAVLLYAARKVLATFRKLKGAGLYRVVKRLPPPQK